jgi:hypothetical protein
MSIGCFLPLDSAVGPEQPTAPTAVRLAVRVGGSGRIVTREESPVY